MPSQKTWQRGPIHACASAALALSMAACGGTRVPDALPTPEHTLPTASGPIRMAVPIVRWPAGPASNRPEFADGFEDYLRSVPAETFVNALVDLTRQVDLPRLGRLLDDREVARGDRRDAVIAALEQVAHESQAELRAQLDADPVTSAGIHYIRPVAIVNRLLVEGTAEGILALGAFAEIATIVPEWRSGERRAAGRGPQRDPYSTAPGRGVGETFTSWAIEAIGAHRLWSEGLDGAGIVIACIDTGVYPEHEQLTGRRVEGEAGWFDAYESRTEPYDSDGHGTLVLSQAVGGNPEGRVLGIAPGARWAAALANYRNRYSRTRLTLAADWVLRVARPDIVINAWSDDFDRCTRFDVPFIDAWKAAGMFVVFPAGNAGPEPGTGESPAQLTGVYPGDAAVFSVSGLASDLGAHIESSRGPSACGSDRFPSLAVPGADLPFAYPGSRDSYGVGDGTSLGAGLAAGAAALLLQADRELLPGELEDILIGTARDLGRPGRDDDTGAGILDLPAALQAVRERRTGDRR